MSVTIEQAVAVLRAGGIVGMPTETVYGLAADARDASAVARVFTLKGRPSTNPLIVHVASVAIAERYAVVSDAAGALFARFSPGALTIVMKQLPLPLGEGWGEGASPFRALPTPPVPSPVSRASQRISSLVTAGLDTVGIRIPDHPVALALLRAFDGPLAAPSANVSNHVSPTTAEHVHAEFGKAVPVLEGGACQVGIESTVLSLVGDVPRILRPGAITRAQIEAVIGPVAVFGGHVASGVAAASPGQGVVHYAPRAPAWRFEIDEIDVVGEWLRGDAASVRGRGRPLPGPLLKGEGVGVALIAQAATVDRLAASNVIARLLGDSPADAAQRIYATLRELDALRPTAILIEMPPADDLAWAAVRDRLTRATRPIVDGPA